MQNKILREIRESCINCCIQYISNKRGAVLSFDPNLLSILTGTVALDDEATGVRRSVSKVIIHPGYDGSWLPQGDVALIEVIKYLHLSKINS